MEVGSDTFPRDEVTGLAAFEHLEPVSTVSTLNMMEEPAMAPVPRVFTPPPPGSLSGSHSVPAYARKSLSLPPPPPAARAFSRPPPPAGSPAQARRQDDTEIVDVDDAVPADRVGGWEEPDDAATRVQAGSPAAELHMDWDDEEPPTQMRGEGGVHQGAHPGVSMDWENESIDTRLRDADDDLDYDAQDGSDTAAYQPAGDSGRPSPFPTRTSAVGYAPAAEDARVYNSAIGSVRPGAPSPFANEGVETAWGQDLRGSRHTQLWIAAAALAIIALAFGVRSFFAKEAPGLVTLATVPSDARVLIDGKPVAGTSSPFSANDLAPGIAHEIVVQKDGFAEQRSTFTLSAGEAKSLPTISLTAASTEVGFAIDSVPGGAQIQLDGAAVGLSTPARVTHVVTGLHKVALVHAGYAPYELQVFVPEKQVLELPTATLNALIGSAAKGAETTRASSASQPVAEHHHHHHGMHASDQLAAATTHTQPVAPAARVTRQKPIKAPLAAPAAGKGILRVNSRPWSQVFVDGRMLGNTPQMALQLGAGTHTVKLSNPQMGLSKTFSVTIKAGQSETKVLNLID